MNRLGQTLSKCRKLVLGMVHIQPTPGSPSFRVEDSISDITTDAIQQAHILMQSKIDGIIIENMHDRPYSLQHNLNPIVISLLSIIGSKIREMYRNIPIGVQILAGANKEALSVAAAADLDFVRCEGFVFGHVADEGWIQSCASSILRYRKEIQSNHLWIMADVKKKHCSHAITSDVTLVDTVKAAEFFFTDSVVITGNLTGLPPDLNDLRSLKLKKEINIPISIGSGITLDNIELYFEYADIFIVGSHFKVDGIWTNQLDRERISIFMEKIFNLRNKFQNL